MVYLLEFKYIAELLKIQEQNVQLRFFLLFVSCFLYRINYSEVQQINIL